MSIVTRRPKYPTIHCSNGQNHQGKNNKIQKFDLKMKDKNAGNPSEIFKRYATYCILTYCCHPICICVYVCVCVCACVRLCVSVRSCVCICLVGGPEENGSR